MFQQPRPYGSLMVSPVAGRLVAYAASFVERIAGRERAEPLGVSRWRRTVSITLRFMPSPSMP